MRIVRMLHHLVNSTFQHQRAAHAALMLCALAVLALRWPGGVPNSWRQLEPAALARGTAAAKQQGCCANQPAEWRRMIGTYYTTEDNFRSTLVLNNKGPNVIAVTPILHGKNGQRFNAPDVYVTGESSVEVDLNALAANAGAAFRSGSFEFTYQGRMMEMGGGLRIVDAARSLIFDEQLLEPGMKFSSSQLEAVFAIPSDEAHVSVIVTNTTAQPLTVSGAASFASANGQRPLQTRLKPYETEVIELPNGLLRQAAAGAVSLKHNGGKGALLAIIHVQNAGRGYSATVNFADPAQGKTAQLHGAGLRLGRINNEWLKPVIAVRNHGAAVVNVTARVPYAKQNGATGTITLPGLELAPGELKLLNTSSTQLRQADFATAGLELDYTGAPGSVVATAESVSASGNHVFALPLKDPQGGMSSTGGYPWFINGTSSTVIFIKNVTSQPQEFHLGVIYPGGKWGSNLKTLAPGQTYTLDLRKIRDTQEVGSEGNPVPAEATSGHIAWSARGKSNKVLIGRAQTVDFTNALAATYECQCPCQSSYAYSYMSPGSVTGFIGNTSTFSVYQVETNCYGTPLPAYHLSYGVSFSSANTSVATVNSSGLATAAGVGTTQIEADWNATVWTFLPNESGGGEPGECIESTVPAECSASCQVIDFTLTNDKATEGVRPTGIIAGLNGADPAITDAETKANIEVVTNPATSGLSVSLSVVANQATTYLAGGHVNHTGVRPVGTLSRTSGTTDQNGRLSAVYTAPPFGGGVIIRATINGVTKESYFVVYIVGLSQLQAGNEYTLTGGTATHPGDYNHYGTAVTVTNLPLICNDYEALYPGSTNPEINDMSLPFGGKFEIAADWGAGSHGEHRVGRNCDFESTGIPANRWAALNVIFTNRNVQDVHDETALRAHWHLRFRSQ